MVAPLQNLGEDCGLQEQEPWCPISPPPAHTCKEQRRCHGFCREGESYYGGDLGHPLVRQLNLLGSRVQRAEGRGMVGWRSLPGCKVEPCASSRR